MSTAIRHPRRGHRRATPLALTTAVLVVVTIAALMLLTRPGTDGPELTGAVNGMGLPVMVTPGAASGIATAGQVEVSAANWALGQVPLDVAVQPTWRLENTGDAPVALGEPYPEVRAGCCPGPLTLGTTTLAPGEQTTLTFDLAMHEGMDGWHDMAVHVPVGADGELLSLEVTGDFRS